MAERPREFPRLIYNSDGDSTTLQAFPPPITTEQMCRDINELRGTAVDVFTNSMGRGDDTFSHHTEFGGLYGEDVTEWPEGEGLQWVRRMAENTHALLDQGIDINTLLAEKAHAAGLQFWPALRMNDIHEDDSSRFAAFRSTFKKEHPELLIGSPYPSPHGYPDDNFTWAFDYAKDAVRERKLGLILETCERYDVDGFELDFQRGPWYFKNGQERQGVPLMTDFVRKIRAGTREIAHRKNRPFTLMVRVPPTMAKCLGIGLDVPTWIKEELADLIVLMDKGYLDMGADVKGAVELAKGTGCRIGGGLEHIAKGYGYAGANALYAAALGFWHQGASSIYMFNYDCHRLLGWPQPYTPEEIQVLREIHDPNRIARKNKRYAVTQDMLLHTPAQGGLMPLPFELSKGQDEQAFTIWVGDDVESAREDAALDRIYLRLTFAGHALRPNRARVIMNGKSLPAGHIIEADASTTVTHDDAPVVRGKNEIAIALADGAPPLRIEGIEVVITYV